MEKVFQSVEEILADEIFQAWYLKREAGRVLVWENWMESHPAQRPLVNEAVMCMQNILMAGGYFWLNANKRASIRSSYGQLQFQKLPDGTEVTLNANSAISFSAGW